MYMTGFADEAADSIEEQIRITKDLGWKNIESRNINGKNLHDISDEEFERVAGLLNDAGVRVNCFGSTIANWAKKIDEPFDSSLEAAKRAIPRMKQMGTKLIRIMSFAIRPEEDQMEEERFKRLREIVSMFKGEGLQPAHENCMNYGGMSADHTLKMIENVPGLKLILDTGNPVLIDDYRQSEPRPKQKSFEFYNQIKDHIAYVHIKDCRVVDGKEIYTFPGEGDSEVPEIVSDLVKNGYDGGISIEPHMGSVFHDPDAGAQSPEECENIYKEYGRRMMNMLDGLGAKYE